MVRIYNQEHWRNGSGKLINHDMPMAMLTLPQRLIPDYGTSRRLAVRIGYASILFARCCAFFCKRRMT